MSAIYWIIAFGAAAWAVGLNIAHRSTDASRDKPVREWFRITIGDDDVGLQVTQPRAWSATVPFGDIVRVCLKMEPDAALGVSNGIYLWVKGREHSYAIPVDAENGWELLSVLQDRGLLPAGLVIKAMGSASGTFCWPPV